MVSAKDRHILWDKCDDCGKCVEACPSRALEMVGEWLTVEQVMDIVGRDLTYYRNSGGGVTFSGGEPTVQHEFLISCLQSCKNLGIHTALDTCGYAKWSVWEEILPYTDLLLYDIKCIDSRKSQEFSAVGNELILENLKKISQKGKSIWIRIQLIPGHNDSEDNLRGIAEFIRPLKGVRKVSLLPYNPAAGVKYEFIGKNYALEDLTPHSEERAEGFARIFSRLGIRVELGR
jgi:pyruvate formate lyase activating enzyme